MAYATRQKNYNALPGKYQPRIMSTSIWFFHAHLQSTIALGHIQICYMKIPNSNEKIARKQPILEVSVTGLDVEKLFILQRPEFFIFPGMGIQFSCIGPNPCCFDRKSLCFGRILGVATANFCIRPSCVNYHVFFDNA